ncbi:MAG: 7-cyano-7-deazaguanine synthase QueC [Chloroflexota bacterium]|nr:MAG: 7-cyano-7-deazaguanine synthase QueC [Chloroflexota bacterium]
MAKAVVLFSGGLDSTTVLAMAHEREDELHALTFDYGQRHRREIVSAERLARQYQVIEHKILRIDLGQIGGSALTADMPLPEGRDLDEMSQQIPSTYVPFRNSILLSFAAAYAEVAGADTILAGMNSLDYSGYPDCRPAYLDAFNQLIRLGAKACVEDGRQIAIHAPLLYWDKARIVQEGMRLGVPYEQTWSCYRGEELACGVCDSCQLRLKGFREAGFRDPLPYGENRQR